MINCPNCGVQVKIGTKFCPKCGKPISQKIEKLVVDPQASTNPIPNPTPLDNNGTQQQYTQPVSAQETTNVFAGYGQYLLDALKHPGQASTDVNFYGLITMAILVIINTITVKLFFSGIGQKLTSALRILGSNMSDALGSDSPFKSFDVKTNLFIAIVLFLGIIAIFCIVGFGLRALIGTSDISENFLVYTNNFMHSAVISIFLALIGCLFMMSFSFHAVRVVFLLLLLQLAVLLTSFVQTILQDNISYKIDKFYVVLLGLLLSLVLVWFLTKNMTVDLIKSALQSVLKPTELEQFYKEFNDGMSDALKQFGDIYNLIQ